MCVYMSVCACEYLCVCVCLCVWCVCACVWKYSKKLVSTLNSHLDNLKKITCTFHQVKILGNKRCCQNVEVEGKEPVKTLQNG